jgi:hypothetical protein
LDGLVGGGKVEGEVRVEFSEDVEFSESIHSKKVSC